MWTYQNPVRIRFGAGALDGIGDLVHGRTYCLVTYDEAIFHDITQRIAVTAGPAALIINNVIPNPDFRMLAEACAQFAAARPVPEVIVALGGGSVTPATCVACFAFSHGTTFSTPWAFLTESDCWIMWTSAPMSFQADSAKGSVLPVR